MTSQPGQPNRPEVKSQLSRRSFLSVSGLSVIAGSVGVSALLDACSSSPAPGASASSAASTSLVPLSVQLQWIENVQWAGSWVADSRGYYKQAGVQPTFVPGGPSTTAQPLVASGKADIGISDVLGTAQARAQGAPLVIIGATYQKNPNGVASRADNPIRTPAGLIGKKVGVPPQGIATYQTFMKLNHLDPDKATVVPIQTDPSPLASGEIDALFCYVTNQPVTLETRGAKLITFLLADFGLPLYDDVYFVTEATLNAPDKRQAVVSFLKAEQKGWQAAVANAKLGATLAVETYGSSLKLDLEQQVLEAQAQDPLVQPAGFPASQVLKLSSDGVARNLSSLKSASVKPDSALFNVTVW
jgi:ABC-type nitrate/sulfonate/bicarbonate transport system substrate-binding protein